MSRELPNPPKSTLYSGLFILSGLAIVSFMLFIQHGYELFNNLISLPDTVSFNKGIIYLLGVSLGLMALLFVIVYESVLRKTLTKKVTRIFSSLAILSVVLIFLLPFVIHRIVDNKMLENNYLICEKASHQWLHSRIIVYVASEKICIDG